MLVLNILCVTILVYQSNQFALSVIPWDVGYKRTQCGGGLMRPLKNTIFDVDFLKKGGLLFMQRTAWQRVLLFLGISRENMTTKTLVRVAMLTAIAILMKSYGSLETGIWRLSFYELPLIMLGVFFGPIPAFIGGLATDFGYIMSRGWMYGINFFTISTVLWAFVPAMLLFRRKYNLTKLIVVVAFTSLLAFSFNTLGLVQFWGTTQLVVFQDGVFGPMFPRIITALVKLPVQVYLVHILVTRLHLAFSDLELVTE